MKNEMIKRRFSVIIVSALIMLSLIIMTSCGRKDENVRIEKHVSQNENTSAVVYSQNYAKTHPDGSVDSSKKEAIEASDDSVCEKVEVEESTSVVDVDIVDKMGILEEPTVSITPISTVKTTETDVDEGGIISHEAAEKIESHIPRPSRGTKDQSDSDSNTLVTSTVVPTQTVIDAVSTRTPVATEKQSEAMPKNSPAVTVKPNTSASEFTPTPTATLTPTVVSTPTQKSTPIPTRVPTKPTTQSATITSTAVVTKVPTTVITKAVTPTVTISPTPKATNKPKPTAATKKNSPTPTVHVHNWVDVTKTVHHEAKGYWLEEWDEDIYITTSQCRVCKKTSYDLGYDVYNLNTGEFISTDYQGFDCHCGHCGPEETAGLRGYRSYQEKVNTIHHEPEYFIYSNAYDEKVPGSRCSECGEEVWAW